MQVSSVGKCIFLCVCVIVVSVSLSFARFSGSVVRVNMEALRTISTASISPANAVVVKVAFPEFGIIKSIRVCCSVFLVYFSAYLAHSSAHSVSRACRSARSSRCSTPSVSLKTFVVPLLVCVFCFPSLSHQAASQQPQELYSIFIPAVDANGTLSFTNGKWCDDATLVSDCHLCPMHKLILARRVPESSVPVSTTTPTASPDTAKKKSVSTLLTHPAQHASHPFSFSSPFATRAGASRGASWTSSRPTPGCRPGRLRARMWTATASTLLLDLLHPPQLPLRTSRSSSSSRTALPSASTPRPRQRTVPASQPRPLSCPEQRQQQLETQTQWCCGVGARQARAHSRGRGV